MSNKFGTLAPNAATPPSLLQGEGAGEHIDQKYFVLTIVIAVMLHMMGLYAWHLAPTTQVLDIPVRALSIKLGDGEPLAPEDQPPPPASDNKSNVENALSKVVRDDSPEAQARTKSVMSTMDKAMTGDNASKAFDKALNTPSDDSTVVAESARKLSNVAQQFIRTNAMQAPSSKGAGSILGNSSAKEAEMMTRYEQLVSLWIKKFQIYPDEARSNGMQGETVIRIRIDRQGNIRYYILERSTGSQVLDKAAIDMVKRANPVPAVPNDYPPGDLIEFLIPVSFILQ